MFRGNNSSWRIVFEVLLLIGICREVFPTTSFCELQANGQLDSILQTTISTLNNQGYDVKQYELSFASTCGPDSLNCFGNNPSSPYGLYHLPSDIFLGKSLPYWQLEQSQAVVFFGCTPPLARYFGWRSYVVIGEYTLLFASLGDTNNQLTANSTGTPGGPSEGNWNPSLAAFGEAAAVITTADQVTDSDIRQAFASSGFSSSFVNTDAIPFSLVKMGEVTGNLFTFLYRIAGYENSTLGEEYQNYGWPVLVITPPDERKAPFVPFPVPLLRQRDESVTEFYLNETFNQIVEEVKMKFGAISDLQAEGVLNPLYIEGFQCIANKTDCIGDNRDAAYMDGSEPLDNNRGGVLSRDSDFKIALASPLSLSSTSPSSLIREPGPQFILSDDPSDFVIIVGIDHTLTTKATYTNVAVYDVKKELGVGAILDDAFTGSTNYFLNSTSYLSDYVYIYKFARNCTGELYCFTVPVNFPGVPLDSPMTLVERAYLEPRTAVGPDAHVLLWPTVLHFSKTSSSSSVSSSSSSV